jgi:transposase-like protein
MHLIGKRSVSSLCEEHGIAPSLFYKWQQQLFEQGSQVFDQAGKAGQERRESQENRRLREQLEKTEAKLANKHEVLSELMSEHIALKKSLGD